MDGLRGELREARRELHLARGGSVGAGGIAPQVDPGDIASAVAAATDVLQREVDALRSAAEER